MKRLCKEYYIANATILSPEALEEIHNSRGKVKNAVTVMAKKHHITTKRIYEMWLNKALVPPGQNSDNEKSSHNSPSLSNLSQKVGKVLETKKEQVSKIPLSSSLSPIILQDSEDALEVFKKSQNGMEKAVAKGRSLEQKLKT
ncbi:17700_t:CDS:2 [Funneliformis geosporum]|nr:17700_t:CDS:2 [Funneliformis geosporum]